MEVIERFDVYKVFTPTTPARLAFVERDKVNEKLVNALRTPGKQVIVYGHSGSGKTTLLVNKLHQLYEHHITSRCMKSLSFESLVVDAFDQLAPYYISEKSNSTSERVSAELSQDYLTIKSQFGAEWSSDSSSVQTRALPPQLTPQALGRFMGESKCCWVIEDFHKIAENERCKLSQVMKIFMDMADEYPTLKVVAIGAVDTARQVVEYDPEMKNRVAEIHVPLMEDIEIKEIIAKGSALLNVSINDGLATGITSYSNGVASVGHHLCLNICIGREVYFTSEEVVSFDVESLQSALQTYLDESSDSLKKAFDSAFKQERPKRYDNARLILKALSQAPQDGATRSELYEKIKLDEPKYPQGNLTVFLEKLSCKCDVPLIRLDVVSGKYSFLDPIYRAFALAYFKSNSPKRRGRNNNDDTFNSVFGRLKLLFESGSNEIVLDFKQSE